MISLIKNEIKSSYLPHSLQVSASVKQYVAIVVSGVDTLVVLEGEGSVDQVQVDIV